MNNIGNNHDNTIKLAVSLLIGAASGLLISGALLCISAAICVKLRQVPTEAAAILAGAVNAAGAFAAGYIAVKLFGSRGMLTGAAAGLLMICAVCLSGGIAGDLNSAAALTRAIICMAAAAAGGILRVNKKQTVSESKFR